VLDNTVIFGLERLTGGKPVFMNCTQEALEDRLVMVLPPKQTVLELLETLEPTPTLLHACRQLKAHGFRLALDDFEWKPEWAPFAALADYIKVDLSKTTRDQRMKLMEKCWGNSARFVAERVETPADMEQALNEGFKLFQGYYFCRLVLLQNRVIPPNRLVQLELLKALHQEPLDTQRVSSLVKRDASLTYRLLRMVNSPLYGMGKVIRSIHQALVLIGDEMFRRVATLAIASELVDLNRSELLRTAFTRGRFCELAAAATGQNRTEQYLVGVLSLLPAILRLPMENIAVALPFREEIRDALLGVNNSERAILNWLASYETGQWEQCDVFAKEARLSTDRLPQMYAEAVEWAETNLNLATS
jgi:c-di-GMP-related signal transduction protein